MRWGNRLPRDMLDNGEEDGNLMIHKRTRNLVKSGIWHKFTVAQVLHNKLNAAPLQSTISTFWEAGTWPPPFLDLDPLFNIDFGGRRQIWNELFWSEFV